MEERNSERMDCSRGGVEGRKGEEEEWEGGGRGTGVVPAVSGEVLGGVGVEETGEEGGRDAERAWRGEGVEEGAAEERADWKRRMASGESGGREERARSSAGRVRGARPDASGRRLVRSRAGRGVSEAESGGICDLRGWGMVSEEVGRSGRGGIVSGEDWGADGAGVEGSEEARTTWGGGKAGRRVPRASARWGRRAEARGVISGVEGMTWT